MADRPETLLEQALGHRFADRALLHRALVHRSYEDDDTSNERLEFLGDAVLGLVVADEFLAKYDMAEGEMAKVRASVVSEPSLARVAREVGLGEAILMGRGEEASGGRDKPSILADAMEALLGAVFLNGGFDASRSVIRDRWRTLIVDRAEVPGGRDWKTRLQEVLARDGCTAEYTVSGSGPDHARAFTATVMSDGRRLGTGVGTSKKRAEQGAAREALDLVEGDPTADA